MKNENNFRVQMMRVKGDYAPFVKVEYLDQDANEHAALLLVDSCSCHNVLIGPRAARHGVLLEKEEGIMNVYGSGNVMVQTSLAKSHFAFGGKQFHESFCIYGNDMELPAKIGDLPLLGILGNLFMQQNHLTIDYSDYTLHTSDVNPENLSISDCEFFFPMEIGMERYNLPVLALRKNDDVIVLLADTGATNNMIAAQSIEDFGLNCRFLESTDVISGIAGSTEVHDAMMDFSLLTYTEGDPGVVHREDLFKVTPHYIITPEAGECDKDGELLPPIVGIIGSPFMAKEKWALDFGAGLIYRSERHQSA